MDSDIVRQLIIIIIFIALSAFFSSAETALTTVNKIRIKSMADEGDKRAKLVQKLISNQSKLLTAVLIGNNIVNLSVSSMTTMLATKLAASAGMSGSTGTIVGLATGILTLIILVFGEIVPKTAATLNADKMSLAYSKPVYAITVLFTPLVFIMNKFSNFFVKLLGMDPEQKASSITENELLTIIDVSHEEGVLESEEKDMINNVVGFGDALAKDIMIPRIDIVFASVEMGLEDLIALFREEKYSRIPVYEDSKDHIVGIVNMKDIFCYEGSPEEFAWKDILRRPFFTYEYQKTSDLMLQMREKSFSMAIVLDEYGATSGLITLEDLLEEIVGEIRDEYDEEDEEAIRKLNDYEYIVDGTTKLEDLNEAIGTDFSSDDYDSIAGHVIHLMEHIPAVGESIETPEGICLIVENMDKNRIDRVHLYLPKQTVQETKETK